MINPLDHFSGEVMFNWGPTLRIERSKIPLRLNKIGKSPLLVSKREDLASDCKQVVSINYNHDHGLYGNGQTHDDQLLLQPETRQDWLICNLQCCVVPIILDKNIPQKTSYTTAVYREQAS